MSDNIKQESVESLQTKEQEQQAGSNKRTLEAENDKAAKKAFKEKKKKEKQPADPAKKKKRRKKWPIFLESPSLTYQDLKRKLCRDCDAKWYAMNSKL